MPSCWLALKIGWCRTTDQRDVVAFSLAVGQKPLPGALRSDSEVLATSASSNRLAGRSSHQLSFLQVAKERTWEVAYGHSVG